MFSKKQEYAWTNWLLSQTRHSHRPVVRFSIERLMSGGYHVDAMLMHGAYYNAQRGYIVGAVKYNSELRAPWGDLTVPFPLLMKIAPGNTNRFGDPDWRNFI